MGAGLAGFPAKAASAQMVSCDSSSQAPQLAGYQRRFDGWKTSAVGSFGLLGPVLGKG